MKKHIVILEPNDLLRSGLKAILADDPRVGHITEGVNMAGIPPLQSSLPQIVILNYSLLHTLAASLKKRHFVVLTNHPSLEEMKTAYEGGACGYLSTNASYDLLRLIPDVNLNTFLLEPSLTPLVIKHFFDAQKIITLNNDLLTPREKEIMSLLNAGLDRTSIARNLHIESTTLKTHIKNIARKKKSLEQIGRLAIPC